jgi:DNA-binding response OmpR family regulator
MGRTSAVNQFDGMRRCSMAGALKVLVVDDDPVTAELISVALECLDAACEWVDDGRRAIERLQGDLVDLVILDVQLPRVSGMEVLQAMRRDPFWASTPVVVVTNCDMEDIIVAALYADADDVLPKPINIAELRARVARRLRSTAPRLTPARAG